MTANGPALISQPDDAEKRAFSAESDAASQEEQAFPTGTVPPLDDAAAKRLLRKIDYKLVPFLTLLYLLSFLDRVNIGQAKIGGLATDLHLKGNQYNVALVVFFVSYVAFEIPSNFLLKRFRPTIWIPAIMIAWSVVMIGMGFAKDFKGLTICRFFLGLAESGLFPGLNFYLSCWYRRTELSMRVAIFFGGATLSGAFGGLLAYGISFMDGLGGLAGWSWIFIIEGLLTLVVACAAPWLMADWPSTAKFLTPVEREQAVARLNEDQGAALVETGFSWHYVIDAMTDYRVYCYGLLYLSVAEGFYGVSLFTPTIIANLGHWTRAQSNLLSTPPFFLGFFTTILTAYFSDRIKARGVFLTSLMALTAVGYVIIMAVDPKKHSGVCYFALFIIVGSVSPCISTTITWCGNNLGPVYKRAAGMGFIFSCGNAAGIISSLVYISTDAPRFFRGHGVGLAFAVVASATAAFLTWDLKRENARREALYGDVPSSLSAAVVGEEKFAAQLSAWGLDGMSSEDIAKLGDKHPGFRYIA